MRMSARKLLARICAVGMLFTVGGVYATWHYILPPDPILVSPLVGLDGFYYKTEEVLPGDSNHQMNAFGLLDYIVHNVKIGLNSSKGDRLLVQIEDADNGELHSRDNITSSNLKHIFEDTASTALEFTLEYISDTEIWAYVYMDTDIDKAVARYQEGVDKVRILTYKAVIIRSAAGKRDWDHLGAAEGYATVERCGGFYAIDAKSWAGKSDELAVAT